MRPRDRVHGRGCATAAADGDRASAYRIVQEALANVAKHAGDARASVQVAYEPSALVLAIADDGHGDGDTTEFSGGHGLIGMRERVALFGGDFAAGPDGARGFRVSATFPCETAT